ncbi:MAG TPA: hypothetical protein VGM94_07800 [Galbitalea sp.]|jgi:hypothetical protein
MSDSALEPSLTRSRRHSPRTLFVLWILVFASVVPWRQGSLYTGSIDPVVIGKAAVSVAALVSVALVPRRFELKVGIRSIGFVIVISVVGMLGALRTADLAASATLTVRLLLVAVTIILIARRWTPMIVLSTLLAASGTIAVIAGASGAATFFSQGRLEGVIPPLHSNELALLAALPLIALIRMLAIGHGHGWHLLAAVALAVVLLACDSRTALAALVVAILTLLLTTHHISTRASIALIAAVPICALLLTQTGVLAALVTRNHPISQIVTLNSRTIAWNVVLATPWNDWARWWGTGYSTTQVAVTGQYWETQVLDSSWVSALAQVGVIGTVLLLLWVTATMVSSLRRSTIRALALPIMIFVVPRSVLESGLVDSSTFFVFFFSISVLVEPISRIALAPARGQSPPGALAAPRLIPEVSHA